MFFSNAPSVHAMVSERDSCRASEETADRIVRSVRTPFPTSRLLVLVQFWFRSGSSSVLLGTTVSVGVANNVANGVSCR